MDEGGGGQRLRLDGEWLVAGPREGDAGEALTLHI